MNALDKVVSVFRLIEQKIEPATARNMLIVFGACMVLLVIFVSYVGSHL